MELSRRTFTALAGTAALGLALAGSGGAATGAHEPRTVPTGPPPPPPSADGRRHRIGYDRYSLLVDGRRLVLWSGELHPFRLPGPSLWRDALQKLRASGYNAVSVPVPWAYHSPAPGRHDFTGVRDLNLFLTMAAEERLYVVLRPGPHLGAADLDAGGLPGWLTAAGGRAGPGYARHVDAWLSAVNRIAVRHLYTAGGGTVLLYQFEDGSGVRADDPYLTRLHDKARADRIDVPLFHADGHFGDHAAGRGAPGAVAAAPGGAADVWGGKGYAEIRRVHDAAARRRDHLAHLADGVTVHNVRMAFGGTSWGWLSSPAVYTSYDYGAAIDEARRLTPALAATQQLGHLLRTVPDLARLDPAPEVRAEDGRLSVRHLANPDTGAQVYVVRNDSPETVSALLPDSGIDVPVTVGAHDAKLLTTGLRLGHRKLAFSTAQPALSLAVGRQDIALFTGRAGETAQVALDCGTQPLTNRLDDEPAWSYDRNRLNVVVPLGVGGLSRLLVENGDSETPMVLLFADDATALRLWPCETPSGSLLVYGPALLRSVTLRGSTAHLVGDLVGETGLEVWVPRGITAVTWNGRPVRAHVGRAGSLVMDGLMPGAPGVRLPALEGWRGRTENPEAKAGFDDSAWTPARLASAPEEGPVLLADAYGFHHGDVWYRGRFENARGVTSVSLSYGAGPQGLLMAWLDGSPLGTHRVPVQRDGGTATASFEVPGKLRRPGEHVLSVLVRPMQHDGDGRAQAARGLMAVEFGGRDRSVEWRIQGAAAPDRVRGPLNNGGLYGEREGWHLPGFDDGEWRTTSFPREGRRQGVAWYRTRFRLDVPSDVDASVGLTLDDDPERAYRVQIFLNGWNMGQYINDVGPQHTFVLPNGILRTRGANTLALAVLSDGTTPSGPHDVHLTLLGAAQGGITVKAVDSPGRG